MRNITGRRGLVVYNASKGESSAMKTSRHVLTVVAIRQIAVLFLLHRQAATLSFDFRRK